VWTFDAVDIFATAARFYSTPATTPDSRTQFVGVK